MKKKIIYIYKCIQKCIKSIPKPHNCTRNPHFVSGDTRSDLHFELQTDPRLPISSLICQEEPRLGPRLQIPSWGKTCQKNCFPHSTSSTEPLPIGSEGLDSEFQDLSRVHTCYHDLKEVSSKTQAMSFPLHRPYNCAIDQLLGTSPPNGRLYSLSGLETLAMRKYVEESLAAGIIRPASSPAGAGFFYLEKKGQVTEALHRLPRTSPFITDTPSLSFPLLLNN